MDKNDFISQLIAEINNGRGIVPLIGSGCSSASGILMGQQFDQYLAYTIFLCIAPTNIIQRVCGGSGKRWNLHEKGWPNQPNSEQLFGACTWIRAQFGEVCKRSGVKLIPATGIEIEQLEHSATHRIEDFVKVMGCPFLPRVLRSPYSVIDQQPEKELLAMLGSKAIIQGQYTAPGKSPTSEDAIIERAIRSLHDWRATLRFLSEIRVMDGAKLLLSEADHSIIDRFNVHITNGRKPNLLHNMLCHLAGPARFRIILTTNFDTLIEDAFQQMREKIEPISVSIKGSLPDPEIVHSRNTLIKMHGTLWETRADFSLDESPSIENKRTFYHYIKGEYPDNVKDGAFQSSQILVCGYSGSDNRCVELIKYTLDGDSEAKVYWICHSEQDEAKVALLFCEKEYSDRIVTHVTNRPDLLLYELYQRLCLSLPPGGFSYQYSPNAAPDANWSDNTSHADKNLADILSQTWFRNPAVEDKSTAFNLMVIDGGVGMLSTLRRVAHHAASLRMQSIWLELEDYPTPQCMAYDILLTISIRLGLFQLNHANLIPQRLLGAIADIHKLGDTPDDIDQNLTDLWIQHFSTLITSYFPLVPKQWIIILYGRNGPGGCAGFEEGKCWGISEYGSRAKPGSLAPILKALSVTGFQVIYAPYSQKRKAQDQENSIVLKKIIKTQIGKNAILKNDIAEYDAPLSHDKSILRRWLAKPYREYGGAVFYDITSSGNSDFEKSMSSLCETWVRKSAAKNKKGVDFYKKNICFLYSITLFRQSRHYSAFLNEGTMQCPRRFNSLRLDNDELRDQDLQLNLEDLQDAKLFYKKPGGFAWAYRDYRLGLRRMIEALSDSYLPAEIQRLVTWRSYYHYWIADWYVKAFYSTGHATPLLEAIYHQYQSIKHLGTLFQNRGSLSGQQAALDRSAMWKAAVLDMTKLIQTGSSNIRFWVGAPIIDALFSDCSGIIGTISRIGLGIIVRLPAKLKDRLKKENEYLLICLKDQIAKIKLASVGEYTKAIPTRLDAVSNEPSTPVVISTKSSSYRGGKFFWRDTALPTAPPEIRSLCDIVFNAAKDSDISKGVKIWRQDIIRRGLNCGKLFKIIQQLNIWAFAFVKRAKLLQIIHSGNNKCCETPLLLCREVRHCWVCVCVLSNCAVDLCRLIDSSLINFEQHERVRALSIYGLALGRLSRFKEAHRRINEASAQLSKLDSKHTSVLLGILALRRAEVFLLEALFLKAEQNGKNGNMRDIHGIITAKLDDSWCALESAERLLAGRLHSPRWWGRLCVLKLRCFATLKIKPHLSSWKPIRRLAQRIQMDSCDQILKIIDDGLSASLGYAAIEMRVLYFGILAIKQLDIGAKEKNLMFQKIGKLAERTINGFREIDKTELIEEFIKIFWKEYVRKD